MAQKPRSELWQRIRAAREYANKMTQDRLGAACSPPVNRAAVAQWEADTEERRTTPKGDKLMMIATATGVPIDWLLDDASNADTLHEHMQRRKDGMAAPVIDDAARLARAARAFWSAVRYSAVLKNPLIESRFDVALGIDGVEVVAPFLFGRRLAVFAADTGDWKAVVAREVGALLTLEKLAGHECEKALLIWSASSASRATLEAERKFGQRLGVGIMSVSDVEAAAKLLAGN
jgi:transcriptional regulator with XRE-family HTH domain